MGFKRYLIVRHVLKEKNLWNPSVTEMIKMLHTCK